jgi:hypothetical protein
MGRSRFIGFSSTLVTYLCVTVSNAFLSRRFAPYGVTSLQVFALAAPGPLRSEVRDYQKPPAEMTVRRK